MMQDIQLARNAQFVENGDFRIGECNEQNKLFLLTHPKGVFKNAPLKGIGIRDIFLSEREVLEKKHEIRRQFIEDGATVKKITLTTNKLIVDANY